MSRTLIGRTVRRLRTERGLSQQALATRLGISASYLNLIEHDQRAITASLFIKLGETLRVDLGGLSGSGNANSKSDCARPSPTRCSAPTPWPRRKSRRSPQAARTPPAILALYRAWRVAREDANGIALPSGRRILLPNEEVRDFFDDQPTIFRHWRRRRNHRSQLAPRQPKPTTPSPSGCAACTACRSPCSPWTGALRRYDPATRVWCCRKRWRGKAAASRWHSSSHCWKRATRWKPC